MRDYKSIFDTVEATLLQIGSRSMPRAQIQACLDEYKHFEGSRYTDDECYTKLVHIIFYAGFRAATVTQKIPILNKWFPRYEDVASYSESDIHSIMADVEMIRHESKIRACVTNARTFKSIVSEHGSFQNYVDSFDATRSPANWNRLRDNLRARFDRMGRITPYHFMMDVGLPLMKPDIVVSRIFYRLGLIEREKISTDVDADAVVEQGRRFASVTGHPIRYIDIVFVCYGQVRTEEIGIERGVCLGDKFTPSCKLCKVTNECRNYFQRRKG
jgi:DNA-3-methyladenine glycosylase I